MTPYLVTPPLSLPVDDLSMKAHLRVAHDDDDADIFEKQSGAVAALDGWGGQLGRCIMPQVWAVDVIGPGPHLLPFPDASNVTATVSNASVDVTTIRHPIGTCATVVAGSEDAVTIAATYGLPRPRIEAARTLIKLMVQREFDVMAGPDYDAITRTISHLIKILRWSRV
ncbi:MAG: head-tail connector protein [Cypionkella sp.]|nr:head-tail connector protein [Cypionkella sp.]